MESSGFTILVIGFIWVLNLGISYWNARVVGTVWIETKMMGGFTRFMVWMGAIMAACGFTWCLLIFFVFGGHVLFPEYVTKQMVSVSLSLGYLVIVPAILFSGFMIWIDSIVQAWRRRDLPSMGIAAWNTFAQIHNTYQAIDGIPQAFGEVMNFFGKAASDSDDAKSATFLIVIGLVVMSLVGGIIITMAIIKKYAATVPLPDRDVAREGEYLPRSR